MANQTIPTDVQAPFSQPTFLMNDGKYIPCIGFGTYGLVQGDETKNAVLYALEADYRLIDCARFYNNERSIGEAIEQSGISRAEIFISSKVWNDRQLAGPDEVRRSVEETLSALKLDYLDLLLIHWPVQGKYRDTWEQFQLFKEEGLTVSIGVSNFQRAHLDDLLSDGDEFPVVDQIEFHPYLQDNDTLACCKERDIVMQAWSPFSRGKCLTDQTILDIAKAHETNAAQVILAWELSKDILPLPRSSKQMHIINNRDALNLQLTSADIDSLNALNRMEYTREGVDPIHFNEILEGVTSPRD